MLHLHLHPAFISFVRGVDTRFPTIHFHFPTLEYTLLVYIRFPKFLRFLFPFLQVWLSLLFAHGPYVTLQLDILVYQVVPTRVLATSPGCTTRQASVIQVAYTA